MLDQVHVYLLSFPRYSPLPTTAKSSLWWRHFQKQWKLSRSVKFGFCSWGRLDRGGNWILLLLNTLLILWQLYLSLCGESASLSSLHHTCEGPWGMFMSTFLTDRVLSFWLRLLCMYGSRVLCFARCRGTDLLSHGFVFWHCCGVWRVLFALVGCQGNLSWNFLLDTIQIIELYPCNILSFTRCYDVIETLTSVFTCSEDFHCRSHTSVDSKKEAWCECSKSSGSSFILYFKYSSQYPASTNISTHYFLCSCYSS